MTARLATFWQSKTLDEFNSQEWELLCDGCGLCCLHKLEDEDSGELFYTDVGCRFLGADGRCMDYAHRATIQPACLRLSADQLEALQWVPESCAYRLLALGEALPAWHHLVCGDREAVHTAARSVRGRFVSESLVAEEDYEEHIIHWLDDASN